MSRIKGWIGRHPWLMTVALIVALYVPGFVRVEQINDAQDQFVACLTGWADDTGVRTAALTVASDAMRAANDRALRAAASGDIAALRTSLADYVTASDAYKAAQDEHPVPQPPTLRCDQ